MKLEQWAAQQPWKLGTHASGAKHIPDDRLIDRTEAFHLEDYLVSSVIAGTIWFVQRSATAWNSMRDPGED